MNKKRTNNCERSIFTLDGPIQYQIKIAGQLNEKNSGSLDMVDIQHEADPSGLITTILTGIFDQAALLGLLRRIYYLGFPLIAVNCVKFKKEIPAKEIKSE